MNMPCTTPENVISLDSFIAEFGDGLLDALNHTHPPVYDGQGNPARQAVMDGLARKPFPAQADVVQAITALLLDQNERAGVINAEMGTGKTMMAIAVAAVMANQGYRRSLIVSPPHLVYKWRREILETVPLRESGYSTGRTRWPSCSSSAISWVNPAMVGRSSSSSAACVCGWDSTGFRWPLRNVRSADDSERARTVAG